jgi:hypothetical protein
MSDEEIGPKTVDVDGVQYNYRRVFVEHLLCETCGGMFITHIMTGQGVYCLPQDKTEADACPGCQEMLREQDITLEDRVKPS